MTTTTATVETLTAEVRVLMVGNRQITMSVAKQLDMVPIDEIEIFGRVKLWEEGEDGHGVQLIGRSPQTGALVTSWAHTNGMSGHRVDWDRIAELRTLPLIVLAGLR